MARSSLIRTLLWAHRQVHGARLTGMPLAEFTEHAAVECRRRRDFLKQCAGAAALGVGLATLPTPAMAATAKHCQPAIAIIGGGMAGLMCAWELKKKGVHATVYEGAKRITGRIFTDRTSFASQRMFSDLGGEYIDTDHTTMRAVARHFGLKLLDYNDDTQQTDTYLDFGGHSRTVQELLNGYQPIADAIDAAYDEFTDPNGTVLFNDANGGERLDNLSVRGFLAPIAAPSWVKKLIDVSYETEFGLDGDVNNSLNMIYLISTEVKKMKKKGEFDFYGISDERFHCAEGNDAIPRAVAGALCDGQIEVDRVLTAARKRADGRYVLTFAKGGEVTADHVVFALPFSKLREVDLTGLALPDWKVRAINEISYGKITKIITGHTRPVWRELGYIGDGFSDRGFQSVTETSRMQPGTTGILENYTVGQHGIDMAGGSVDDAVRRYHNSVENIYPGLKATYNGNKVRMAWHLYPFTKAAYSSYTVGQYTTIAGAEPIRVGNLHFCGEHTTVEFQGWMEGAARSGVDAAAEIGADLQLCPCPDRTSCHPGTVHANT